MINKLKDFLKSTFFIYPLVIIIAIPTLLVLNTYWNLRSFNRDVNFFIRHQAVSTFDTVKPFLLEKISSKDDLNKLLVNISENNSDVVSSTIISSSQGKYEIISSSDSSTGEEVTNLSLNQLALGFNQPFAGLSYDPNLRKNVWIVTIPFTDSESKPYLFFVKLKTDTVDEILGRTSSDSVIVLLILVIVTLILLSNHFLFYKKAVKAQELAEIDRLKDEFISIASHELRTPVTALSGYLELLTTKIPTNLLPTLKSELDVLNGLTKDLNGLISELLDVSRIEQGRLQIKEEKVNVNEIVVKVIDSLTPQASGKGLALKFESKDLPTINTDPSRLRQVLVNLVGNSIKYTLKGEISVGIEIKEKFLEFKISDTGIGIPPEEALKLFTKFHRVVDKQTQEVRGTGLGLWITKQIVELMGGKIFVQSIYGTGSSFIFTIPLKVVG